MRSYIQLSTFVERGKTGVSASVMEKFSQLFVSKDVSIPDELEPIYFDHTKNGGFPSYEPMEQQAAKLRTGLPAYSDADGGSLTKLKNHEGTGRCSALFRTFCLLLLAIAPTALRAAIINVPANQPTIQAAINAAANGDTILVAPGTYYENINFNGKAITVTSSGGAAVTTINGGYKGGMATVIFNSNETSASVLSRFHHYRRR